MAWSSAGAPRASHSNSRSTIAPNTGRAYGGLIGPAPWLGAVLKKVARSARTAGRPGGARRPSSRNCFARRMTLGVRPFGPSCLRAM